MYLLLRAGAEIEFKYFFWLFGYIRAGEFEVPAWVALVFYFGKDLLWAVIGMFSHTSGSGVAFGAHVGGFLAGLALVSIYHGLTRLRKRQPAPSRIIIDPAALMARAGIAPAPVTATSETPTIYLHDGQQQTGPFTLTEVQASLQRGELGLDASYWSEGMAEWQSVVDLAGQPLE
jgi:hypothetical protein